ncbi:efflux RND transporter periplasmic adaptor subunit [Kosakonia sp. S42]|uniref:efflux RND transporter periplasmic adaptor subunit n=1 Tax=Kosakonia sp. S42 TaxID=2767458 RepID=UPI00190BC114|nr:efflux RND transporter periplasmic adaptor subunit [Kosakonia sp. S42]MBK0019479.1 efflux RND transporter periplasmic adaptor subunit [Kosakonia sp. S42]
MHSYQEVTTRKKLVNLFNLTLMIGATNLLSACDETPASTPAAEPPMVGVYKVEPSNVRMFTELPGRTSAYLIAEVRPQVGGILLKRNFTEGSDVKEGQTLYHIDSATYKATLASADANLESSRSLYTRYSKLAALNVVSQQNLDDAKSQYLQAKANVDNAKINLNYTEIKSPISGRIGRSNVTQGALVTAGQTNELATVQQLDPIYVDISQPASALVQLREDLESGHLKSDDEGRAKVSLKFDNGTKYKQSGTLQFSEISVNESTGSVTLRAVFPNPDGILLPGMFVRAQLQQGIRENAILVPQRGVTRDTQGKAIALVVDADNVVQQKDLSTNQSIDGNWLISAGLKPGEQVIVDGLQNVTPGMIVKPVQAAKNSSEGSSSKNTEHKDNADI